MRQKIKTKNHNLKKKPQQRLVLYLRNIICTSLTHTHNMAYVNNMGFEMMLRRSLLSEQSGCFFFLVCGVCVCQVSRICFTAKFQNDGHFHLSSVYTRQQRTPIYMGIYVRAQFRCNASEGHVFDDNKKKKKIPPTQYTMCHPPILM